MNLCALDSPTLSELARVKTKQMTHHTRRRASDVIANNILHERAEVEIVIHDVSGRAIQSWRLPGSAAGIHRVEWDGAMQGGHAAPRGVYFIRVTAGSREGVARLVRVSIW